MENEVILSMNLTFRSLQFPLVSFFRFTQPSVNLLAACEWADLKCFATTETPDGEGRLAGDWRSVSKGDPYYTVKRGGRPALE